MSESHSTSAAPSILCVGELVWDVFLNTTGNVVAEHLGGAPMNVAYHLRKLGCDVALIARVGDDLRGENARRALVDLKLPIAHVQRDALRPTGCALVTSNANGEPQFELLTDVAWDFIAVNEDLVALSAACNAIVFGSLAQRAPASRMTIRALLGPQRWRVFDVNLRPPFDDWAIIEWGLQHANVVKVNASEIAVLSSRLALPVAPEAFANALSTRYALELVLVTLGAQGAGASHAGDWSCVAAPSVDVVDTVGAGDAFLGGFLSAWLHGISIEPALTRGCALGALVASRAGATPAYEPADIQ